MENENWKKGIENLKNIKLSKEEEVLMYKNIINRSPYIVTASPFGFLVRHYTAFVSMILVFILGGSVVVEAENSLPGSTLYSMKINITEPIRGMIKIQPEDKVEWQAEKVARRIEEAEILAVQNKLDDKKREKIEKLFEKSISDFDNSIKDIATSSTKERVKEIESNFNNRMSAHSKVVERVDEDNNQKNTSELKIFERNVKSVLEKDTKKEKRIKNKDEGEEIEKIVEKRLKELEKEREKSEKKKEENKETDRDKNNDN